MKQHHKELKKNGDHFDMKHNDRIEFKPATVDKQEPHSDNVVFLNENDNSGRNLRGNDHNQKGSKHGHKGGNHHGKNDKHGHGGHKGEHCGGKWKFLKAIFCFAMWVLMFMPLMCSMR